MLFNSWTYIVFLIIATSIYFLIKNLNFRVYFICVAGLLFYSFWRWEYTSLMILTATIDYLCALRLDQIRTKKLKDNPKIYVIITLVLNLGFLVFFKYTYFLYDNFVSFMSLFGMDNFAKTLPFEIILPLGISFYTFHSISYTIDIYRNTYPVEKNFFYFMGFVTFWPQLVAGPILRADEILGQFYEKHQFKLDNLYEGGKRILFGLFNKVVLADNIGKSVDDVFSINPSGLNAWDVMVCSFLFGFQIYFDFSGYSSIAVGSGRILGFKIPENFNWPYLSKSPREFWKNWHISLSSWIRDYLYIPLTGQKFKITHGTVGGLEEVFNNQQPEEKKVSATKINVALFATWIIMGLWHGASWNFALWGIYHAFFIFLFKLINTSNFEKKLPVLAIATTFFISMMGWIPFRAAGLSNALTMYGKLFIPSAYNPAKHAVSYMEYIFVLLIIAGMVTTYLFTFKYTKLQQNKVAKILLYGIMTALVITYMQAKDQFIYFQF